MKIEDFKFISKYKLTNFASQLKDYLFNYINNNPGSFLSNPGRNHLERSYFERDVGVTYPTIPHDRNDLISIINLIDRCDQNKRALFAGYRAMLYQEALKRYIAASDFLEKNKTNKKASAYDDILRIKHDRDDLLHVINFEDIPQKLKNKYSIEKIETIRTNLKQGDLLNHISIDFDFGLAARCLFSQGYTKEQVSEFEKEVHNKAESCTDGRRGIGDMHWSVLSLTLKNSLNFDSKDVHQNRYTSFELLNLEILTPSLVAWFKKNLQNEPIYDDLKNSLVSKLIDVLNEKMNQQEFKIYLLSFYKDIRDIYYKNQSFFKFETFFRRDTRPEEFLAIDALLDGIKNGNGFDEKHLRVLQQGEIGNLIEALDIEELYKKNVQINQFNH